ncbi:hypothetical protein [Rhodopila sp.]|uniref:hypothetical protein n=1 Tax=Rhodopila sp. TaxID=2480087 RepID=UPI003D10A279
MPDAVDQFRCDRNPRTPGKNTTELLRSFPGGALVHFAVSNKDLRMTSRLAEAEAAFLPFNQGHEHGAGKPPKPSGAPTAYLWQSVWQRDGWLEILGRYIIPVRSAQQQVAWIFPRFHELAATCKLVHAVLNEGPGGRYLSSTRPGRARPTPSPGPRTSWSTCTAQPTTSCSPPRSWSPTAPCWTASFARRSKASSAPRAWSPSSPATAPQRASNSPAALPRRYGRRRRLRTECEPRLDLDQEDSAPLGKVAGLF